MNGVSCYVNEVNYPINYLSVAARSQHQAVQRPLRPRELQMPRGHRHQQRRAAHALRDSGGGLWGYGGGYGATGGAMGPGWCYGAIGGSIGLWGGAMGLQGVLWGHWGAMGLQGRIWGGLWGHWGVMGLQWGLWGYRGGSMGGLRGHWVGYGAYGGATGRALNPPPIPTPPHRLQPHR